MPDDDGTEAVGSLAGEAAFFSLSSLDSAPSRHCATRSVRFDSASVL